MDEARAPSGVESGLITFENGPARRIVDGGEAGSGGRWFLYVLRSVRLGRTYVGIAKDPLARLAQHNGARPGGARATRSGRPWALGRVFGPYESRSTASKAEHRLKKRRGAARLADPAP